MPPSKQTSRAPASAASSRSAVVIITELGPNDVLMGRGALATDYEGNLRLRELVSTRHEDYNNASRRADKHRIAEEIVQTIMDRGGRFLQSADQVAEEDRPRHIPRDTVAWLEVPPRDRNMLYSKVKQLLRDVRRWGPKISNSVSPKLGGTNGHEIAANEAVQQTMTDPSHSPQTGPSPHTLSTNSPLPATSSGIPETLSIPMPVAGQVTSSGMTPPSLAVPLTSTIETVLRALQENRSRQTPNPPQAHATFAHLLPILGNLPAGTQNIDPVLVASVFSMLQQAEERRQQELRTLLSSISSAPSGNDIAHVLQAFSSVETLLSSHSSTMPPAQSNHLPWAALSQVNLLLRPPSNDPAELLRNAFATLAAPAAEHAPATPNLSHPPHPAHAIQQAIEALLRQQQQNPPIQHQPGGQSFVAQGYQTSSGRPSLSGAPTAAFDAHALFQILGQLLPGQQQQPPHAGGTS